MKLKLQRQPAEGKAVRGRIEPLGIPTLENAEYLIPCGTYPLTVTYSPRFKRLMPLVCNVPATPEYPSPSGEGIGVRLGIRFHPGTRPEHSQGCILVSRAHEDRIREIILRERCTLEIIGTPMDF